MIVEMGGKSTYIYTGGEEHSDDRDVICFVHGAAMDHTVWTLFARYWAKQNFNVVAVDLPGHGLSTGEPLPSIARMAGFLCKLMRHCLPDNRVHWVGHSMGSLVALECAQRDENTAGLVMMGTAYPMKVGKPLLESAKANDHLSIELVSLFGHSYASQLGGNPNAGVYMQNLAERLMEQSAEGVMYADLNACNSYKNGLKAARSIECPVGLILGELDMMTPPHATASLIEAFASPMVKEIAGSGHMLMTEKPDKVHHALVECMNATQQV